jgi:hypothetical protein
VLGHESRPSWKKNFIQIGQDKQEIFDFEKRQIFTHFLLLPLLWRWPLYNLNYRTDFVDIVKVTIEEHPVVWCSHQIFYLCYLIHKSELHILSTIFYRVAYTVALSFPRGCASIWIRTRFAHPWIHPWYPKSCLSLVSKFEEMKTQISESKILNAGKVLLALKCVPCCPVYFLSISCCMIRLCIVCSEFGRIYLLSLKKWRRRSWIFTKWNIPFF